MVIITCLQNHFLIDYMSQDQDIDRVRSFLPERNDSVPCKNALLSTTAPSWQSLDLACVGQVTLHIKSSSQGAL